MQNTDDGLAKILNSPESMRKIAEIAQALKSDAASSEDEETAASDKGEETAQTFSEEDTGAIDLPATGDLSELLSGLKISPTVMKILSGAARGYGQRDKRIQLLEALRPVAHGSNAETIDRAINAVRIAKTAKTVLSDFGGGDKLV